MGRLLLPLLSWHTAGKVTGRIGKAWNPQTLSHGVRDWAPLLFVHLCAPSLARWLISQQRAVWLECKAIILPKRLPGIQHVWRCIAQHSSVQSVIFSHILCILEMNDPLRLKGHICNRQRVQNWPAGPCLCLRTSEHEAISLLLLSALPVYFIASHQYGSRTKVRKIKNEIQEIHCNVLISLSPRMFIKHPETFRE